MSSQDTSSNSKIGPRYETSPISFEANYVEGEFPSAVIESDYKTLAWIILKVVAIEYIRSAVDPAAIEWPDVKELIRHKDDIIKRACDAKEEDVKGYLNQHLNNSASSAVLRSVYDGPAFDVYLKANGGFKALYDPAVYHFTGWKIHRN